MTVRERDEPFDWNALVPHVVHPLKVSIIEALWWIGRPLSPTELTRLIDDEKLGLSHVSYHVNRLTDAHVLKRVRRRQVRGSVENFYFFAAPR